MSELILSYMEKTYIGKRWHFYTFCNAIHATISKTIDKQLYYWKIENTSRSKLLKEGSCFSYNESLNNIEKYLHNELLIIDVY